GSLAETWYVNGIKVIPRNIHEYITSASLAYWYMDDGQMTSLGDILLHTNNFALTELIYLVQILYIKFGLIVNIRPHNGYYILAIAPQSRDLFIRLVAPYIVPLAPKAVFVYDLNGMMVYNFKSVAEARLHFKVSHRTVLKYIESGKAFKGLGHPDNSIPGGVITMFGAL
ncbi:hypothetical protein HDV05_003433, partial [Chytridiales sp. JEL 0842]